MTALGAELWFLWRDRAARFWLGLAAATTIVAVLGGVLEVRSQRAAIERLLEADAAERQLVLQKQKDWGGVAYYTFHLTFSPPSNLAFAALGQRDVVPWKHRIRMLALEGQIYETDVGNPAFALIGRFDFAFVASTLAPLFVIFLLHALRSSEREAGRFELLVATAANSARPWLPRSTLRMFALAACILVPFVAVGLWQGSEQSRLTFAAFAVLAHLAFWWLLTEVVSVNTRSSAVGLTLLMGLWLGLAVVAPAATKTAVEGFVPVPDGGDILLVQRESVNDAWDLPKSATMQPFIKRHPEWQAYAEIKRPFEWKWYYAFQQVGDQAAEALSRQYMSGRHLRDQWTGWLSLLSPPSRLERILQALARTDVDATLAYEQLIRRFHARLRAFYYPRLFEERPFEAAALKGLPRFDDERTELTTRLVAPTSTATRWVLRSAANQADR